MLKALILKLIWLYQRTLSPDHGILSRMRHDHGYCRYQPTCSQYMYDSIEIHGIAKGIFLGVARITRCHPWAAYGSDPVLKREYN